MRILVISPKMPYPLNEGANLRTFNILRMLSKNHETHLAFLAPPGPENSICNPITDFSRFIKIDHMRPQLKKLMQMALSPLKTEPYLCTVHQSKSMGAAVKVLAAEFDAIQAEFPYTAQYITGLDVKKVLDQHNVEADILKLSFRMEKNWARKVHYYLQYRKMAEYERQVCARMDSILATSEDDKKVLSAMNPNVTTIPNAVSEAAEKVEDRANKIVTFTGLMSYWANIDALEYFAGRVWPLVVCTEPDARLLIVGKNPGRQVLNLSSEQIIVTGAVPDINSYIRESSVIIAPLRIGSGTRIKILEAMAQGKPVVSSSLGCMGLKVTNGENILIADEPRNFADCILRLLGDRDERFRIGSNALELVRNSYTWEKACEGLKEVYGH